MVLGEDEHEEQGQRECQPCDLPNGTWPDIGLAEVLEYLQQRPSRGSVGNRPLHYFAAVQSRPGALAFTLCRRVGHFGAPSGPECSGITRQRGSSQTNAMGSQLFRLATQPMHGLSDLLPELSASRQRLTPALDGYEESG